MGETVRDQSLGTNDLFGDRPVRLRGGMASSEIRLASEPAELRAAKALAAKMRTKRSRREKKVVAHLICLNLISMLKHGGARR